MRFADHAFETPAPIYSLLITKRKYVITCTNFHRLLLN